MKSLKRVFAMAMLGVALAGSANVFSYEEPEAIMGEKATLPSKGNTLQSHWEQKDKETELLARKHQLCYQEKINSILPLELEEATEEIVQLLKRYETPKSSMKAYADTYVQSHFKVPAHRACFEELDINAQDFSKRVQDYMKRHAPAPAP